MPKRYAWKHVRTPWDGQPGFWAAVNRFFYLWEGPAQLGEDEPPRQADSGERPCPLCGMPMSVHAINRSGPDGRTLLRCPERAADGEAAA